MTESVTITVLDAHDLPRYAGDLAEVLRDAIASGASVGWIKVPPVDEAIDFWRSVGQAVQAGTCILLGAIDSASGRLVGTGQLQPSQKENQPHRADVAKLLVHRDFRGRGIGRSLMLAIEAEAAARGRWLLVLDTIAGSGAESLYRSIGWSAAGEVPDYAFSTEGRPEPTQFMYKALARRA